LPGERGLVILLSRRKKKGKEIRAGAPHVSRPCSTEKKKRGRRLVHLVRITKKNGRNHSPCRVMGRRGPGGFPWEKRKAGESRSCSDPTSSSRQSTRKERASAKKKKGKQGEVSPSSRQELRSDGKRIGTKLLSPASGKGGERRIFYSALVQGKKRREDVNAQSAEKRRRESAPTACRCFAAGQEEVP